MFDKSRLFPNLINKKAYRINPVCYKTIKLTFLQLLHLIEKQVLQLLLNEFQA